jgi:4,5-DOPA dioxygenase extradiol
MTIKELNINSEPFISTEQIPVLFVVHGSPMNVIEENEFVQEWREIAKTLPKPDAISQDGIHSHLPDKDRYGSNLGFDAEKH